jgi:hypothetical protein
MEREPVVMGEHAIVTKGADVARPPDDNQCRAIENDTRCEGKLHFDEESYTWTIFCQKHLNREKKARRSNQPRVERIRS